MWKRAFAGLLVLATACGGPVYSELPQRINPSAESHPLQEGVPSGSLPTVDPPPLPTLIIRENGSPSSTPTLVLPTLTPYPDDVLFSIGRSVEGREIWAWQFGEGSRTIVLVGGIHGGYEANTVVLSERLAEHFRRHPEEVLPGIRLVIIPAANPDGLLRGNDLEGRFNARGVDLNRNWGCEWSETAFLRDIPVDPGPRPFSEPETLALRFYFVAEPPDVVIFYHSALGSVFLGACGGQRPGAGWLGDLLAEATGYLYQQTFSYYEVSGDATNWLAERGIPAAIVELETPDDPEIERNLAGVMALQAYLAGDEGGNEALPVALPTQEEAR